MCMLQKSNVRVKENVWHDGRLKQVNPGEQLSLLSPWVVLLLNEVTPAVQ